MSAHMKNKSEANLKIPEILAPAGSFASLTAAIKAGADSVYLGVADFNMRATAAKNFKIRDLSEIVERCHKNNAKVFLTVNTIFYNNELSKMREIIDSAIDTGVDAIIAADMAAIQYAREKKISVQISTQLSISNTESLRFYSQYADRVVLARELDLDQIRQIKDDISSQQICGPGEKLVELELLAHGALCVAVSGRCGMNLFCGSEAEMDTDTDSNSGAARSLDKGKIKMIDTSANRGKCTQICRRKFKVIDEISKKELQIDNNFVMSSADLCTIGMLPELISSGADVLKIEGRGRPAEYVMTVVSVYREALEAIYNETYSTAKVEKWRARLNTVFNRGQSAGMYRGASFARWAGIAGSRATTRKKLSGIVEKYYPRIQVAQVLIRGGYNVSRGDKFLISGDNTGAVFGTISGMMVDDQEIDEANQGDVITFKVNEPVRKGDDFYLIEEADRTHE
ncbi:U32 family peptidase [Candidatus Dojkabacteria bacterium]|nr:U32 family peptidase [Candidatus Dojkabacteria bacterium]